MKIFRLTIKWLLRAVLGILALILLAVTVLYIPPIQDFVVKKVLQSVNSDPSMQVNVSKFRLTPPLSLRAQGVSVLQQGDTMVAVNDARLKVSILPLFTGRVNVSGLSLDGVRFNLGTPDSALYLTSSISQGLIDGVTVGLINHNIGIDLVNVSDADIFMSLKSDTTATDTVTASDPLPWKIDLHKFALDSLKFAMTMDPTIDSLGVIIPTGTIDEATIDLSSQRIDARSLTIDSITAAYLTPAIVTPETTAAISTTTTTTDSTSTSLPWEITVGNVHLTGNRALYGVAGASPLPGLDMNYIEVTKVDIIIDSLYNRGVEISVPMKRIAAHERSGLDLLLTGLFTMNEDSMNLDDIHLSTLYSAIDLNAMMGMKSTGLPMPLRVKGSGYLSPADVNLAMPAMQAMTSGIPATSLLDLNIDIEGARGWYDVNDISLRLPRCFDIAAHGTVYGLPEVNDLEGRLDLSGHIANGRWIRPSLVAAKLDKTVTVPPLSLKGDMRMHSGSIHGKLSAVTDKGKIALDATWTGRREAYDVELTTTDFPVDAFMPTLGVERVTASANVTGHGYNPMASTTYIDADVIVKEVTFNKRPLSDIELRARVDSGRGDVLLTSSNKLAAFDVRANGNLTGLPYAWTMQADLTNIDLQGLGLTDSVMSGSVNLIGRATITPGPHGDIAANIDVRDLDWKMSASRIATTDLRTHFLTNDSVTSAMITNHDLTAHFESPMSLDTITGRLTSLTAAIDSVMSRHYIDVKGIQHTMPPFTFSMTARSDNIINNYLASTDMGLTGLDVMLRNDSLIDMSARVLNFNSGTTVIDTITANIYQNVDTLKYLFKVGNRPGTLDQWAHVAAYGRLSGNHASFLVNQENIDRLTGYRLGLIGQWLSDEVVVKVVPQHPIIGYKTWTVNDSNFISFNTRYKHFDADLDMHSSESSIHLYTDETEHKADSLQEDLILDIKDIKLQEWLVLNPFAPPITGNVSADMRFGWDNKSINGSGLLSLEDFTYGKERVGSFDLGLELTTNTSGTVRASASLMVDSIKTITAVGNLNDSTARNPFLLDFRMIHFPLHILNPFLPKDMARLNGSINGVMDITGSLAEPIFNGHLTFDSTALTIPMFGTTYRFSDKPIPMDSNVVTFDNYRIESANDNPLVIDGTVDARHISDIRLDLEMAGNEMQIINSKKKRGVLVFGKAFANLQASVRGNMERLNVDATVDVLENTNVTYVLSSATENLSSRSNINMVKFVNFADSTLVVQEDSITSSSMMMSIDATLRVYQGSVLTVDLSTDGKNRVQLLTSGSINYNMNYMGDSHVTGRLNLNGGYVRYTPPLMSEKLFNFQDGSYVSFNGDMMNPYLNIKAIDVLRANVQQEGQNSRLINFDVILSITNSLDNMDLSFDLSTNDDITVANELQSMTPEQRANQAMNLLLYNVYTGPGTKASSSLSGNPLYSFLESQVNSWAANNIKGVDLSFGIDQYDRTVDGTSQTATSYSYKVSKSLFNDRFKISVGGNYSTDTEANEDIAQNLINDISFEYYLTPSGSMYIKIFRHTGYESILEGEVTQTGVGFVYKRKLRRLNEMFKPLYHRVKSIPILSRHQGENKEETPEPAPTSQSTETPKTKGED